MFEAKAVFLLERLRNADLSTYGGVIAESKQFFRISHHSPVKNSADAVFSTIFPSVLTPPFDAFSTFENLSRHRTQAPPALAQAYR
ncbi:MAG TPA: hypothetical protein PLO90_06970 [Clostridia bacterium]|jgi:hypothetical protein|nr:hypothetical protein [Clostridia bacterium]HQA97997.1 hypothetical protein [Clostridia bacterium]HUM61321.1 hypothetical protein [Clostridia bacterium]